MAPPKRRRRVQPWANTDMDQKDKKQEADNKSFINFPLDVFLEVVRYLQPIDILYLARTTKSLRAFLLDRHRARQIWKTAIENVPGMPPCPDHLSEPAYTHLAFVPVCHGCFKRCDIVQWGLRMRCCKNCFEKMTVPCPDGPVEKLDPKMRAASLVLPASREEYKLRESDLAIISTRMSQAVAFRLSDWETMREPADPYLDPRERKRWLPVIEHARLCRSWDLQRLSDESDQLKCVRQKRAHMIKNHLMELGWTDDIFYSPPFYWLPEVKKLELLTPGEWAEISPKLIASLPKVRLTHMANVYRERCSLFQSLVHRHYHSFSEGGVQPRPIDLFLHQDIRQILESDVDNGMDYYTMKEALDPVLPGLMKQWSKEAHDELISFAKEQLGSGTNVYWTNIVFWCIECKGYLGFDEAQVHEHLYPDRTTARKPLLVQWSESKLFEGVGMELYGSYHRRLEVLRVDREASEKMDSLAKSLGGVLYFVPYKKN